MKKITVITALLVAGIAAQAQKIVPVLKFEQGQVLDIQMELKTTVSQEVMGQSIDLNVDGVAKHNYKVTNATADNSTLHHEAKRIQFNFDGMGRKSSFDSDNPKDIEGPFGKPVKETLAKTFDIIVDPSGTVMMVKPEKIEAAEMDERMKLIAAMLKDVLDVAIPPAKGSPSFFKILPDEGAAKGESWKHTYEDASGKYTNTYTLADITDSTLVVDFSSESVTTSVNQIMGQEITTTMNNKTTGKIIIDKATGIVKQKIFDTVSNGSSGGAAGSIPITSKSSVVMTVTASK